MKYDARACHFNMDTGCVELLLRDGRKISIDCTGVEDALDVTMAQRSELDTKIEQLQSAIATESQNTADAEKWIALMKECVNPTELTAELLNTLIEKIVVHEAVKGEDGSREQEVEIFYRFIGKID